MHFLFEGPVVSDIRTRYRLGEHNYLAKGSSTELYDFGSSVYRLSTDPSSQYLIALGNRERLSVPILHTDFGAVGESDEFPEYDSYWLAEIEKLEPLPEFPGLNTRFETWMNELLSVVEGEPLLGPGQARSLLPFLASCQQHESEFSGMARTLSVFIRTCDGEMDLHLSNFMVRRSTEEVLVVDPAHGMEIYG